MNGPWDLPEGWCWRRFDEVATVASNLVDPADYPDHPHLAPNHVVPGTGRHVQLAPVAEDGVTSKKHLYRPGQIVYSKIRPYLRKATIARTEGLCSADMYPIETELQSRFLMWWMLSGEFTRLALKGRSVIPKINQRELNALPVPVPPPPEQQAIVDTIERMLSRLDVGLRTMHSAEGRLAQLQAAVDSYATYGQLHHVKGDRGDALAAIAACRQGREAPDALSARVPDGVRVPQTWVWSCVDELAEVQAGAAKSKKLEGADGFVERPYLAVANVQRGSLKLDDVKTMWVRRSKVDDLTLRPGDVLFNEGGDKDKLGRGWIWEGQIDGCVHQNHVFRARLRTDGVDPRWLSHWGNVFGRWWFHERGSQTTGIASINKAVLRSLPVPVPPPVEQRAIVDELARRSTEITRGLNTIEAATHRAAALRRSILKSAFEGRLNSERRRLPSVAGFEEAVA